jgi:glycosyltransferase involved in cell wall biosynthesis
MRKLSNFLSRPRVPWVIESGTKKLMNRVYYHANRFRHLVAASPRSGRNRSKKIITFKCGFHAISGTNTGATYAISNVANALAKNFLVEFLSFPTSSYNQLLCSSVRIVPSPRLDGDLYICDAECKHEFYEQLKSLNLRLIITCHSFLDSGHGLSPEHLRKSITYADHVHLVSAAQKVSFRLQDEECCIIPNFTTPIRKTRQTNNIGAVGNFNVAAKNAEETVRIGLESGADEVHLWYVDFDKWSSERLKIHAWQPNKKKIYDSFDVLVFMSKEETFGMVVIEAMSAGMPCVLSSIPVFEALFCECPGVVFIDSSNRESASLIVDDLLNRKDQIREDIINYWRSHYSEEAVTKMWLELLDKVISHQTTPLFEQELTRPAQLVDLK